MFKNEFDVRVKINNFGFRGLIYIWRRRGRKSDYSFMRLT